MNNRKEKKMGRVGKLTPEEQEEHRRESARRWREKNKEKIKEQKRIYNLTHRKEKNESNKRWRSKNKERVREYNRRYANTEKGKECRKKWRTSESGKRTIREIAKRSAEKNRDSYNEYHRKYYQEHREEINLRRRINKLDAKLDTIERIEKILEDEG